MADINKSYQWLSEARLKAQCTSCIKTAVYHSRCRLCRNTPGTVQHTAAGINRAEILWDLKPDKQVLDVAMPADSNIRREENEQIEKLERLKEELEQIRKVKSKVLPVAKRTFGAIDSHSSQYQVQRLRSLRY